MSVYVDYVIFMYLCICMHAFLFFIFIFDSCCLRTVHYIAVFHPLIPFSTSQLLLFCGGVLCFLFRVRELLAARMVVEKFLPMAFRYHMHTVVYGGLLWHVQYPTQDFCSSPSLYPHLTEIFCDSPPQYPHSSVSSVAPPIPYRQLL